MLKIDSKGSSRLKTTLKAQETFVLVNKKHYKQKLSRKNYYFSEFSDKSILKTLDQFV
jgi:hypothetical protein